MERTVTGSGGGWVGRLALAALAALIVATATWSPPAGAENGPADAPAAIQEHGVDGVRLTLSVAPQEVAIDGRVRLTLQLEVPGDRIAALPDLPERLDRFAVAGQSPAESSSEGGALRLRRFYDLEPEAVGDLLVPSLVVPVRSRTGDADAAQEIRTEPVPITVTSVVPEGVDYTEPKDIAPPMSLPRPGLPREVWALLGVVLLAAAAAVLIWRRRRRRARAVRPQPAHLVALAELDHLKRELDSEAPIDTFYVRLSAILRRYLGWRFGLRALMQTTEEFVAGLPGAERALAPYRPVLAQLLASFDLVKFARHRPARRDMEDALRRVREVIEGTGDARVLIDPDAARAA